MVVLNAVCALIKLFLCNYQCLLLSQTDVSVALCATGIRNVRFDVISDKGDTTKTIVAKTSNIVTAGVGSQRFWFVFGWSHDKISPYIPTVPTDIPKSLE
jgi:hypothetical protein